MVKHNLPEEEADRRIDQIFLHKKKEGKTGMHKVMTVDFREINGRTLEDHSELWQKFNSARTTRKNVMHPHTTIISLNTASHTIQSLLDIIRWINTKQ